MTNTDLLLLLLAFIGFGLGFCSCGLIFYFKLKRYLVDLTVMHVETIAKLICILTKEKIEVSFENKAEETT
jgi:hypothetical protein